MFDEVSADRIGQELDGLFDGPAWYLLITDNPEDAAGGMVDVLDAIGISCVESVAESSRSLLQQHASTTIAIVHKGGWSADAYADLERLRAVVRQRWSVLLWFTTSDGVAELIHQAPNFASFFLPNVARFSDGSMGEDIREHYLKIFEERYGLTGNDAVTQARLGTLPQDADHHAWLVLLGHGELIVRPA